MEVEVDSARQEAGCDTAWCQVAFYGIWCLLHACALTLPPYQHTHVNLYCTAWGALHSRLASLGCPVKHLLHRLASTETDLAVMAAALPSLRHMRRLLGGGSALLASCTGHQALPRHTHAQLGNLNELLPSLRSGNMLSLSTARSTSSIGLAAAHQRSQAVCHSHNDVQRNHRSLLSGTSPGALLQGASSSSQGPARTALALPPKPSLQTAASGLITRYFGVHIAVFWCRMAAVCQAAGRAV